MKLQEKSELSVGEAMLAGGKQSEGKTCIISKKKKIVNVIFFGK